MDPKWLVTVTIALHGGFSARIHPKSAGLLWFTIQKLLGLLRNCPKT
jgi:hypothetical protein